MEFFYEIASHWGNDCMMDQFLTNTKPKIEDEHYAYLRSLFGEENINCNMDFSTGQNYQSSAIVSGEGHDLREEDEDGDSSKEDEYNIPEDDDTLSGSDDS